MLKTCAKESLHAFIRVLSGMLRKEAWLQAEACSIFAGACSQGQRQPSNPTSHHAYPPCAPPACPLPDALPPQKRRRQPHDKSTRRRWLGMCQMDASMFAEVINKDWFVISVLRMLREPPEEQTLTGDRPTFHCLRPTRVSSATSSLGLLVCLTVAFAVMMQVVKNIVAHSSSKPEDIAWMCTPSVIEICLVRARTRAAVPLDALRWAGPTRWAGR